MPYLTHYWNNLLIIVDNMKHQSNIYLSILAILLVVSSNTQIKD